MVRSVSVRIEGTFEERQQEAVSRAVTSLGGRAVSWHSCAELHRTYALFSLPDGYDASAFAAAAGAQRIDDPALVVLEIIPEEPRRAEALARALGGAGRPAGIVDAVRTHRGIVIELDAERTPLRFVIDVVDTELEFAPGRRIVPLLAFDDAVLTAAARDLLGDPAIDVSRLIETYSEQ
jgi:hypothetical protein